MNGLVFHFRQEEFSIEFEYKTIHKCRGVVCQIRWHQKEDGSKPACCVGWSACLPQDPFVKETGRRIALRRATGQTGWLELQDRKWVSTFPDGWDRKAWRAAVFECYFKRFQ